MNDQSIGPKVAVLLLRALRKELSDDQAGQDLLARFEKDPDAHASALGDYLRLRLEHDKVFEGKLAETRGLPGSVRAIIYGGKVERLVQVAQAGIVVINNSGIPLSIGLTAVIFGVIAVTILMMSKLPRPTPPMGPDGFNVAVAEFAMVDSNGKVTSSEISSKFSDGLFTTIANETRQLPAALQVGLRGPNDVGIVGDDEKASMTAQHWKATMLIYGRIELDSKGLYQVEPRFYITDTSFSYGSEVTGPDYLGQPVTGLTLDPKKQFEFNTKLNARTQALQSIVQGLAYFSIRDYETAADKFQNALSTPYWGQDDDKDKTNNEGREVAYLLLGAVQLRAWDLIQNPEPLPKAAAAFDEAYNLDSNYARSYLGLGGVAIAQAQILNETRTGIGGVDNDKLTEGINWYSAALNQNQPPQAYIPTKAAFGLGQAHLLSYEFHIIEGSEKLAQKYFQQVIDKYQTDQVSDLAWFAAHAHAGLGRLVGLNSDWITMSSEYRQAIKILEGMQPNPPQLWIARFWSMAGFAEVQQNHLDVAQEYYDKAIKLGTGTVSEAELKSWQEALDWIKKGKP